MVMFSNKCMEVSANEKDVIYSCQHAVPAFISRLRQRQTSSASTFADKILRVATSPASPPFELYLKEQNKFTGFDIDLINDVAKKMGYDKVEFVNTPFDELLPGLNHKKYDIAMNNFSKTKARSIDYAASDSYAKAAFSIVAKKGSNLKADIDSMNGRKVAIKKGASAERVAKSFPGSIIVEYPENASALHAVETGEADYAICGNLTTAYYMTHTDDDNCLQVVGHSERQDDLVVYAEKGNEELIKKFNAALSDYKKSGEYKRLIKFYFGDIEKQS